MDQQTRLESARDRLVAEHPAVFGGFSDLAFQASDRSQSLTIERDAPRTFLFDEEFICGLDDDHLLFGVAHLALRTTLLHHERQTPMGAGHDPLSLAQNYIANAMLVRDGIGTAPGRVPFRSTAHADRVAEELAEELAAERDESGGYVMHTFDGTEHRMLSFEMEFIEDDGSVAERIFGQLGLDKDDADATRDDASETNGTAEGAAETEAHPS